MISQEITKLVQLNCTGSPLTHPFVNVDILQVFARTFGLLLELNKTFLFENASKITKNREYQDFFDTKKQTRKMELKHKRALVFNKKKTQGGALLSF